MPQRCESQCGATEDSCIVELWWRFHKVAAELDGFARPPGHIVFHEASVTSLHLVLNSSEVCVTTACANREVAGNRSFITVVNGGKPRLNELHIRNHAGWICQRVAAVPPSVMSTLGNRAPRIGFQCVGEVLPLLHAAAMLGFAKLTNAHLGWLFDALCVEMPEGVRKPTLAAELVRALLLHIFPDMTEGTMRVHMRNLVV